MENFGTERIKVRDNSYTALPLQTSAVFLRIILEWTKFELELSEDCLADYVMIIDENQEENLNKTNLQERKQIERFCGYFGENITL